MHYILDLVGLTTLPPKEPYFAFIIFLSSLGDFNPAGPNTHVVLTLLGTFNLVLPNLTPKKAKER